MSQFKNMNKTLEVYIIIQSYTVLPLSMQRSKLKILKHIKENDTRKNNIKKKNLKRFNLK